MPLLFRRPAPPLDRFVALLWWHEGAPPAHAAERMLPTAAMQLVVQLRGNTLLVGQGPEPTHFTPLSGAVLSGVYATPFVIPTAQQAACAGAVFRPGGAFPFLGGSPAAALQNTHVSLEALWGADAARLQASIAEAATPDAALTRLEQTLVRRIQPALEANPVVAAAVAALHHGGYRWTIAALAHEIGVSQQRLCRLFHEQVGLTPKQTARLQRFQAALRLRATDPAGSWADHALACGFADQSHLVHDFQEFTGLAPQAFRARWGTRANHLPLDE